MVRFSLYVAAAALFHKTAVIVLPLVDLFGTRNRLLNVIAGIAAASCSMTCSSQTQSRGLVRNYIEAEYSSQGAAIRVAMNLVPAVSSSCSANGFGSTGPKRISGTIFRSRPW